MSTTLHCDACDASSDKLSPFGDFSLCPDCLADMNRAAAYQTDALLREIFGPVTLTTKDNS